MLAWLFTQPPQKTAHQSEVGNHINSFSLKGIPPKQLVSIQCFALKEGIVVIWHSSPETLKLESTPCVSRSHPRNYGDSAFY